jgi:dTDP-4-dehydrorhamnose reductase
MPSAQCAKPRLVVTGASGMLGHALCAQALGQWSVLALYRRNKPQLAGVTSIQIDLTDTSALQRLVKELAPRAIIHAAATAQVQTCEAHPQQTGSINVAVPARLADLCAAREISYLFTSTDLVFDGCGAPYNELSSVNPVCVYGRQKAQAEEAVLQRYPHALVCRLPLMFGLAPYAGGHFTMQILGAIAQGRTVPLLTDEYRTPVDSHSAAQGLLQLLGRAKGLLHLGGRTRISRHDLGHLMAAYMGVAPDMIRPVTIDSLGLAMARAPDCALDSRKAFFLGYDPAPLSAAVKALVRQFNVISNG